MPRRGHSDGDYLFRTYDFHGVQEHQQEKMKQAIDAADAAAVQAGSVEEVANTFVEQFRVEVPELTEGAISVDLEEAQVDVSGDRMRAFYDGEFGGGPRYVPGIRASYFVPFRGDPELFKCQPNSFGSSVPFAEIGINELRFVFERGDQNVAETKKAFDRELSLVKEYLASLRQNANSYNAGLPQLARERVTARRARLGELQRGTESLGIPTRGPSGVSTSPTRPSTGGRGSTPLVTPHRPVAAAPKTYDVALTFAGEDRAYVDEVAKGLKAAGVDVFYDDFEKVNLWGKNLVDHLAEIYQHKSRYVVMFISEHYVRKAWRQDERQNAQARALVAKEEYILPARFDDTAVPGMTNTVGYVNLRTMTPEQLVDLILAKLGRKRP
jgi:hypothetical protein